MTGEESIKVPAETHSLRQKLKDALVALALATFAFINAWVLPLYDLNFVYLARLRSTRATILALPVNVLWLTVLIWLMIRIWRRAKNRWLRLALEIAFLGLVLLPLNYLRAYVAGIHASQIIDFFKRPWGALLGLASLSAFLWQFRRLVRFTAITVGILSPFAIFVLARAALLDARLELQSHGTAQGQLSTPRPVAPGQPRMIWIIFDESDQRMLFEKHPSNVSFSEFDRLRDESLYATNAFPPAGRTLLSMPSLISGRVVSGASAGGSFDLKLTFADTSQTAWWSRCPSIFSEARQLGFNTAVVGWFHPYGRVLSADLNYCWWRPAPYFGPAEPAPFGDTMFNQIACMIKEEPVRERYITLCRQSLREAASIATNSAYGLLLFHLPPPHFPGIYLPDKDAFALKPMPPVTGYFNNLVLADHYLGTIRRALEDSGLEDRTWLLVSADHSWRSSSLYDGQPDQRIPFLLKSPGNTTPATFSPRFNTVLSKELILAILRHEVADQMAAAAWLETHRAEEEPVAPKR